MSFEKRVHFHPGKSGKNIKNVYFCKSKSQKKNTDVYFGKLLLTKIIFCVYFSRAVHLPPLAGFFFPKNISPFARKVFADKLECDAVVHLRDGRYGLIEIKLGGDALIKEGVESLTTLKNKLDTAKMKKPSFLMGYLQVLAALHTDGQRMAFMSFR